MTTVQPHVVHPLGSKRLPVGTARRCPLIHAPLPSLSGRLLGGLIDALAGGAVKVPPLRSDGTVKP